MVAGVSSRIRTLLGELKSRLEATYGERLRGVYLYGSYARGEEQSESDVDVLIILDRVDSYAAEVDNTGYLASELSLKYGVSISRVFVSKQDWLESQSLFLASAREEAIPT